MASSQQVWGRDEGGAAACISEPEKTYPVLKECAKRGKWLGNPRDRMKKLRLFKVTSRGAYSDKSSKERLTPEFSATEEAGLATLC